jgi:HK97 family phage prohead protease
MLHLATRLETKFVGDPTDGEFEGYASVFNHQDAHGDVVTPGAFADSLAQLKAEGRNLPMYANHGAAMGGDSLPVGVWKDIQEDDHGLKVKGQIAAMDTDHGRRIYSLAKSGALGGLSIGYAVPPGGAVYGQKAGEPKRTLTKLRLHEISLVDSPSNALAQVTSLKTAALTAADRDSAAASVAAAMRMHDKTMQRDSYGSDSAKDKALVMDHLRDAHEALTGMRAPADIEGWTKGTLRDPDVKSAFFDLGTGLAGFSLLTQK